MKTENNFIVFEGIDGSGKGTQIEMLKKYFLEKGRKNVFFTFEHTRQNEWSDKIEEVMNGKIKNISAKELQLLYILDRKDHIEKFIKPHLEKRDVVFCDRYFLSTLAYGSLDKNLHWKTLLEMHKEIIGDDFIIPAKTIFFDLDPDMALKRIDSRNNGRTYFETSEKQKIIRKAYLSVGKHFDGFEVIDGSGSFEQVFEKIKVVLFDYL